jgi:hypothetical protein
MNSNTSAQENSLQNSMYKKYAGRYGSTSGISLFADGTYLLYGYATAVFGTYKIEKDRLLFTADGQDLFEVFASRNPSIGDSTRIDFKGFDRGSRTFVELDGFGFKPVFNENANCFGAPFVHQQAGVMNSFTLAAIPSELNQGNARGNTAWKYENVDGYNDFIFVYNRAERASEDFVAIIEKMEDGDVIKLSNYGGDGGFLKVLDEEEQGQWKEMLEWKKQYDEEKKLVQNEVFANQHYRMFPMPETSQYNFDKQLNVYKAINASQLAEDYKRDQYNDPRFIRKYKRVTVQSKREFNPKASEQTNKSIFFTVCGAGSENSYRYKGYVAYEDPDRSAPVIVKPVEIQKQ